MDHSSSQIQLAVEAAEMHGNCFLFCLVLLPLSLISPFRNAPACSLAIFCTSLCRSCRHPLASLAASLPMPSGPR